MSATMQPAAVFDPAIHLAYKEPESRVTMKELGLEDCGISPIAVSITSLSALAASPRAHALRHRRLAWTMTDVPTR